MSRRECGHRYHGSQRSLVRMLGSRLPLDGTTRLYVQLPGADTPLRSPRSANKQGLAVMSEGEGLFPLDEEPGEDSAFEEWEVEGEGMAEGDEDQPAASEKISALEGELARLKAQIAAYAIAEAQSQVPEAPPPPPPPVTLPAPTPSQPHTATASEGVRADETPSRPNMTHVLRNIHSVKLRAAPVARSPGGTPLRPAKDQGGPVGDDPASIIAQALRKKFSHKVFQNSPTSDRDNVNRSTDSFSSSVTNTPTGKLHFN